MNLDPNWEEEYNNELHHSVQARREGNEGMSRVCARRAAGAVIGEYLLRRGCVGLTNSAYDRTVNLINMPDMDKAIKRVSQHFIMKVNEEHKLPPGTDLIKEAAWLKEALLGHKNN